MIPVQHATPLPGAPRHVRGLINLRGSIVTVLDLMGETRRAFCARYADRDVTILGTHFGAPTAGRIVTRGDAWRYRV